MRMPTFQNQTTFEAIYSLDKKCYANPIATTQEKRLVTLAKKEIFDSLYYGGDRIIHEAVDDGKYVFESFEELRKKFRIPLKLFSPYRNDKYHNQKLSDLSIHIPNIDYLKTRGIISFDNPISLTTYAESAVLLFNACGEELRGKMTLNPVKIGFLSFVLGTFVAFKRRNRLFLSSKDITHARAWDSTLYLDTNIHHYKQNNIETWAQMTKIPFKLPEHLETKLIIKNLKRNPFLKTINQKIAY